MNRAGIVLYEPGYGGQYNQTEFSSHMPRTRQELEQIERQILAPFAQFSGDTRGRNFRTAARMAHPIPARPRPRHPLARLPPARIQDAGFSQWHRRPSAHAAHAHNGSRRHLAQYRQRAPAEHRSGRNHRARARPRPFAIRPQGRNRPERIDARPRRFRAQPPQPPHRRGTGAKISGLPRPQSFLGSAAKVWPNTRPPSTGPARKKVSPQKIPRSKRKSPISPTKSLITATTSTTAWIRNCSRKKNCAATSASGRTPRGW